MAQKTTTKNNNNKTERNTRGKGCLPGLSMRVVQNPWGGGRSRRTALYGTHCTWAAWASPSGETHYHRWEWKCGRGEKTRVTHLRERDRETERQRGADKWRFFIISFSIFFFFFLILCIFARNTACCEILIQVRGENYDVNEPLATARENCLLYFI